MKNILLISLLISQCLLAQDQINPVLTDDPKAQRKWVNKQMKSMSLEEKIGQLFMVAAFTKDDVDNTKEIMNL